MAMSESSGPSGGFGVRPANPSRKPIVTSGTPSSSKPPKLPTQPKASKKRR